MSTSLTLWTVPFIKQLLQFFVLRYAIFYQWPVQSVHSPDKCHQKSFLVHLIQAKSHAASKKGKLCCLSTMTESNIKMDLFWGQNITQIMHLFSGLLKKKKIPLANDLRSGMTVLSFLFFYPSFLFYIFIYFCNNRLTCYIIFNKIAFYWAIFFNIQYVRYCIILH